MSDQSRVDGSSRSKPWGVMVVSAVCAATVAWAAWVLWPLGTRADSIGAMASSEFLQAPSAVSVATVEQRDLVLWGEATGHLEALREVDLASEAAGRVVERLASEGQWVEAGAVLVRLDPEERRIDHQEANAELLRARAQYAVFAENDSEADGESAPKASSDALKREYERVAELHGQGLVSERELTLVRRRVEAAELLAGSRREEVRAVTIGLVQAEHRAERAQLMLDRTTLRAPFGGRVADVAVEIGQQVGTGETCLRLLDTSRMTVDVQVLESDMVRLDLGSTAWVRIPALDDQVLEGRVVSINPWIDPSTGTGRVTVSVENANGQLLPGLFAFVRLEVGRLADRLTVPLEAVLQRQGRSLVFRIQEDPDHDGRAVWVWVELGARSEGRVEVIDGLGVDDRVAVDGHLALAHEAPITLLETHPRHGGLQ